MPAAIDCRRLQTRPVFLLRCQNGLRAGAEGPVVQKGDLGIERPVITVDRHVDRFVAQRSSAASISASESPASLRTASASAPSTGAGRSAGIGWEDISSGGPIVSNGPSCG